MNAINITVYGVVFYQYLISLSVDENELWCKNKISIACFGLLPHGNFYFAKQVYHEG